MEEVKNIITVDGIEVELNGEKNLLEVIRKAGIDLPTFCYHPEFAELGATYGACRMCVFENEWGGIDASCSTVPRAGMVVKTNTERLRRYRKNILELMLANHCRECTTCEKNEICKLREFSTKYGLTDVRFPNTNPTPKIDASSPCIVRDESKCILCGACVRVCDEIQNVGAIAFTKRSSHASVGTAFNIPLGESNCVGCGQCAAFCPTGAITIKNDTEKVFSALSSKDTYTTVQIAPAVRVAVGKEFGLPAGEDVLGKIVAALRYMGFSEVYDTTVGADMTVYEESAEFLRKVQNGEKLPLFTSCCPGWVKFVENEYPEFLPQVSTCRSPMEMVAPVLRDRIDAGLAAEGKKHFHVAIMPCTGKKKEILRDEFKGQVDVVLSTVELIKMIRRCGLNFAKLQPSAPDSIYGPTSGAGVIFGVTGGVTEAVLRKVVNDTSDAALEQISYVGVRGLEGVKEATVALGDKQLKIAVVSGLANTSRLLEALKDGSKHYDLVEVMACPGGCVYGGGQPKTEDACEHKARFDGLYNADKASVIRTSQQNKAVEELLESLGDKKHDLLHVHYVKH